MKISTFFLLIALTAFGALHFCEVRELRRIHKRLNEANVKPAESPEPSKPQPSANADFQHGFDAGHNCAIIGFWQMLGDLHIAGTNFNMWHTIHIDNAGWRDYAYRYYQSSGFKPAIVKP